MAAFSATTSSRLGHLEIPDDNEEEEEEEEESVFDDHEDLKKCQDSYDNILFAFYTDDMSAFWISVVILQNLFMEFIISNNINNNIDMHLSNLFRLLLSGVFQMQSNVFFSI